MLLGMNGLRVSEACASSVEDLGIERGHRTLRILGTGAKPATTPLLPRELAVGERHGGPILGRAGGARLDRRTARRLVRSSAGSAPSAGVPGWAMLHPQMLPSLSGVDDYYRTFGS